MPTTTYQSEQFGTVLAETGSNGDVTFTKNSFGLTLTAGEIDAYVARHAALKQPSGGGRGSNANQARAEAQRAVDAAVSQYGEGSVQVRDARAALAAIRA